MLLEWKVEGEEKRDMAGVGGGGEREREGEGRQVVEMALKLNK